MLRLRRSTMNVPANDFEKIKQAICSDVDVIMMDLEDAVPEAEKDLGREIAARALRELDFGRKVRCARINGWETDHAQKDVEVMAEAGIEEIKLTKCESAKQVQELDALITKCEKDYHLPAHAIKISMMIESPLGVLNAYEIMAASDRVVAVSLGAGDMASALGIDRDMSPCSTQFLLVKQNLVLCARAAGVRWILDTSLVATNGQTPAETIDNLVKDCQSIKTIGFNGRSALYTEHIAPINKVFSPTPEETSFAEMAVQNWEKGIRTGDHRYFVVNGRHLDAGKYEKACEVLELSNAVAALK